MPVEHRRMDATLHAQSRTWNIMRRKARLCVYVVQTARSQRVARSGRRRSGVTLSKAVCCPTRAAIRPGQLVLLSAKDSVKAYMRGVDLGCDPASWFSVADASMGEDGRPDLHNVPTHPRCTSCSSAKLMAPAGALLSVWGWAWHLE